MNGEKCPGRNVPLGNVGDVGGNVGENDRTPAAALAIGA